jgi:hypothetical protein
VTLRAVLRVVVTEQVADGKQVGGSVSTAIYGGSSATAGS